MNDSDDTEGAKEPSESLLDEIEDFAKVLGLLAKMMDMVVTVAHGPSVPEEQLPRGLMRNQAHSRAA